MIAALALAAALTTSHAPTGPAGYYWATAFDSGQASGAPGESVSAQFLVEKQSMPIASDHSLTEIYVSDKNKDAAEVGIMTDPYFWGTPNPVLFVASWTAGKFNGYSSANNGYVSTGAAPGFATQPKIGSWVQFGISYAAGQVNVSYGGKTIGHFKSTFWSWKANTGASVYGEAYNVTSGAELPSMDGAVRDFSAGGNHLTYVGNGVSSPYTIAKGRTAFSFSGGNP